MRWQNPSAWLRWQLTQRQGLLWHETCATCFAWEGEEGEEGDAYGDCQIIGRHLARYTHANDACTWYEEANHDTDHP